MSERNRPDLGDWRSVAEKELKGASPDSLGWITPEGITLNSSDRSSGSRSHRRWTSWFAGGSGILSSVGRGRAEVDGKLCAEANVMCAIVDRNKQAGSGGRS